MPDLIPANGMSVIPPIDMTANEANLLEAVVRVPIVEDLGDRNAICMATIHTGAIPQDRVRMAVGRMAGVRKVKVHMGIMATTMTTVTRMHMRADAVHVGAVHADTVRMETAARNREPPTDSGMRIRRAYVKTQLPSVAGVDRPR
jgi:predicted hotdog family 3-hydroxylacyl-ACP dehydratase